MTDDKPNMAGRIGQALYWLGCIAAVVFVGIGVLVMAQHDRRPRWDTPVESSFECQAWLYGGAAAWEKRLRAGFEHLNSEKWNTIWPSKDAWIDRNVEQNLAMQRRKHCNRDSLPAVPYPWGYAGRFVAMAAAAWISGRTFWWIFKGD